MIGEKSNTTRTPIHYEPAEGLDADKFADKMADVLIAKIDEIRVKAGKPPLAEK